MELNEDYVEDRAKMDFFVLSQETEAPLSGMMKLHF